MLHGRIRCGCRICWLLVGVQTERPKNKRMQQAHRASVHGKEASAAQFTAMHACMHASRAGSPGGSRTQWRRQMFIENTSSPLRWLRYPAAGGAAVQLHRRAHPSPGIRHCPRTRVCQTAAAGIPEVLLSRAS